MRSPFFSLYFRTVAFCFYFCYTISVMKNLVPEQLHTLALACPAPLYIVGGSVRDDLANLQSETHDLDICAPLPLDKFILIGFAELLLRKMRLPKLVRSILIPLLALGYLCLTGFSLSTVRAVLMACVLYLAFLSRARYDSFTALCAALMLILFVTPYAVWDLSLWMSFLAAAAIVIFSPACQKFLEERKQNWRLPMWCFSPVRGFLTALFVGVIANLGLLLLSAVTFGELSILSVPVTMLLSIYNY